MGRKKINSNLPQVPDLYIPVLTALMQLGGSGNIDEINESVYQLLNLSEDILNVPHGTDGRSEVEYRLAWARTGLKQTGYLDNSSRGVWALIKPDLDIKSVDSVVIEKLVRENNRDKIKIESEVENKERDPEIETWKEQLLNKLFDISPAAFERLTQRLLRESGFVQVEVTGKAGDGGIDGKGIVKINGFLSFHVIFQCKRYRNSVSPSQIRDFRGAMQGRADKGLFITTGTFTREAIKEATRDGAPPIDLIDGEQLCDKLKELKLGVEIEFLENIKIKLDWFGNI
jgi:restriction system protein